MQELATRIVLIRHGETLWNRAGRIQGHTDIALSPLGLAQAERLAEALADEPLAALYASDLSRAHQTAQALARRLGHRPWPAALICRYGLTPACESAHSGALRAWTGNKSAALTPRTRSAGDGASRTLRSAEAKA